MSGLPREVIRWLQSLDLSFPIRHVRRDFSNGYLVAEIVYWYHDREVQMSSYANGTSLQTKLGNWGQLEKCFTKVKIDVPQELIEGTIHCKPGAAIALLEKLYVLLTKRELHYLPAKGRPNEFNDTEYQLQLPLYARATATRSVKTNIASTELKTDLDRVIACQKTQAIIEHHNEQKKHQKEEFPERYKPEHRKGSRKSVATDKSLTMTDTFSDIHEIKVKQRLPPAITDTHIMHS